MKHKELQCFETKVKLTAIFDKNSEIIEWYFDIVIELTNYI